MKTKFYRTDDAWEGQIFLIQWFLIQEQEHEARRSFMGSEEGSLVLEGEDVTFVFGLPQVQ